MNKIATFTLLFLFSGFPSFSQSTRKVLNHSDYDNWKNLENYNISNDGMKVSYESDPQKGDGLLFLKDFVRGFSKTFPRGYDAKFSANSDFFVFKIKSQADTVRKAKLRKKKAEDLPKDTLGIFVFKNDSLIKFGRVKSYNIPEKEMSWVAFLYEKKLETSSKDTGGSSKDTTKINRQNNKKEKGRKKKKSEGTDFVILNPLSGNLFNFDNITEFSISRNGSLIGFIKFKPDSIDSSFVYIFNTKTKSSEKIYKDKGFAKKVTIDNSGNQCAFISSHDTAEKKSFSLNLWNNKSKQCSMILDTLTKEIPKGWTVSENGNVYFSDDDTKLYFCTAPKPWNAPKDTLLEEEKSKVDIWSWNDHRLQSQQNVNLEKDKKKSYIAVYQVNKKSILQLSDTIIDRVSIILKGNADIALGGSTFPYDIINTWDPDYRDYYLIDLNSGKTSLIAKGKKFNLSLSPSGKYLIWFDRDSCWYTENVSTLHVSNLTKGMKEHFYNEKYDEADFPDPYGMAGWLENDKGILIYDRYDIWKFDPENKSTPVNLTKFYGMVNKINFRYIKLDKEEQNINSKNVLLLSAFYETTKQDGYYSLDISHNDTLHKLILDNYSFSTPLKAKNAGKIIWTKGSFKVFPDLFYSDLNFTEIKKISDINPQISDYYWGSVELVKWTSYGGKQLEGLIYKPENFDSTRKYPMIVYFYEKSSDTFNQHYSPKPSRSVINFPLYVSNGYIIFVPDIDYSKGNPGRDCYNAVISGTKFMINKHYVDSTKIGLQGQSWGGYQVGFLVTQTDIYAAAMAGAPVCDMISAYGGIRWESGSSRESQYEKGQSRIGATLWEDPGLYINNSPIFFADKIKTPLLIMSNDNDGAVPWQQGIEYYSALRRLQKPVWMLTYNNDGHNLEKRPNCVDLSIRMMEFFDHYLKDKPAPPWMKTGITAIEKEYRKGY